jgi:Holliday junction resolvase RusA-like endonuclease
MISELETYMMRFIIPGKVHGQGRARAANGRVYTPKETRAHAERIHVEWIAAGRPTVPSHHHYRLTMISRRARPASHYKANGELSATGMRAPHPGKPDIDNEVKQILDALVSIGAIPDDRMCIGIEARKEWSRDRGEHVDVRVVSEGRRMDAP